MSSYRRDARTIDEFKKDIKESTIRENALMELYVKWLNSKKRGIYTYENHGCGPEGDYIDDVSKVSAKADFVLYKDGKRPRKIEIKHAKKHNTTFHIKTAHINRCIKGDYCIINWSGADTDNPKFCILTPKILQAKLDTGKEVYFWQKKCYKWNYSEVEWINVDRIN